MAKTYLIWSARGYANSSSRSNTATVRMPSGEEVSIQYTAQVSDPSEIKYLDKVIRWSGDEEDILNKKPDRQFRIEKRIQLMPLFPSSKRSNGSSLRLPARNKRHTSKPS